MAYRLLEDAQESFLCIDNDLWGPDGLALILKESSKCVDGIGGTTWDGALHMCHLFAALAPFLRGGDLQLLELGCGSGLLGLFAGLVCPMLDVVLTDREVDLALTNSRLVERQLNRQLSHTNVFPLTWGCINGAADEEMILSSSRRRPDIIVGCEVACLRRQQDAMIASILRLMKPESLVFISFDEPPQPNSCSSEKEFDHRMRAAGFSKTTVQTSSLAWVESCQPPRADDRLTASGEYEYKLRIQALWEQSIELTAGANIDAGSSGSTGSASVQPLTGLTRSSDRSGLLTSRGFFEDLTPKLLPRSHTRTPLVETAQSGSSSGVCLRCKQHTLAASSSSSSSQISSYLVPVDDMCPTADSVSTPDASLNCASLAVQHICVYYRPDATARCPLCESLYFLVLG